MSPARTAVFLFLASALLVPTIARAQSPGNPSNGGSCSPVAPSFESLATSSSPSIRSLLTLIAVNPAFPVVATTWTPDARVLPDGNHGWAISPSIRAASRRSAVNNRAR
jgi:hypothetical protein